jgi:hypothetical protein
MHAESGYWRFPGGNAVEMIISQPSGVQEVSLGTWSNGTTPGSIVIKVVANQFSRTPTARYVISLSFVCCCHFFCDDIWRYHFVLLLVVNHTSQVWSVFLLLHYQRHHLPNQHQAFHQYHIQWQWPLPIHQQ